MADIRKIFGKNVRAYRQKKGLSQEKLAHLCSLHRTYIGGIERGERNISLGNIQKISDALHIKITDLFEGINAKKNK